MEDTQTQTPETNDSQVTQQQHVEVLDSSGNTMERRNSPISSIFDRIEAGKAEGKSAEDVLSTSAPEKKEEKKEAPKKEAAPAAEKKEEKVDDKKDETKAEKTARELLREAFDKKTEEKKAAAADKKEEKAGDEVAEEELAVLPQDKPKTAKRIQALLNKLKATEEIVTTTKKEAEEKAAKLAELEKKLGDTKTVNPETDEKIKKSLDELAMYRRRYELDNDPEVKTKFDARVESTEKGIVETLKRFSASDKLLEVIKNEGGFAKFAGSMKTVNISDGEGGTKTVTHAELADQILTALPLSERKSVEAALMEQIQTKRDRDRYFSEEQAKANDYFKKKEEEAELGKKQYEEQVNNGKKLINEFEQKFLQSDFLKDKEIPANATKEQKQEIEEYNKYNEQLRSLFKKALGPKDLNEMMEIFSDSIKFYDERRTTALLRKENERLKAEIAAKHSELDKVRSAGRAVKTGSIAAATPAASAPQSNPNKPRDISSVFDAIARGENVAGGDE